jgi:hypothetical protein
MTQSSVWNLRDTAGVTNNNCVDKQGKLLTRVKPSKRISHSLNCCSKVMSRRCSSQNPKQLSAVIAAAPASPNRSSLPLPSHGLLT